MSQHKNNVNDECETSNAIVLFSTNVIGPLVSKSEGHIMTRNYPVTSKCFQTITCNHQTSLVNFVTINEPDTQSATNQYELE